MRSVIERVLAHNYKGYDLGLKQDTKRAFAEYYGLKRTVARLWLAVEILGLLVVFLLMQIGVLLIS